MKRAYLSVKRDNDQTPEVVAQTSDFMALSAITESDVFRCRVKDDKETIEKYRDVFANYMEAVERDENPTYPFPAIAVWKNGSTCIRVTGFHRLEAARRAGLDKILVTIFEGTEDNAFKVALADNSTHGLRLNQGDWKYCIEKAAIRFPNESPGVIASMLGCSRSYASEIINELSASGQLPNVEKRRGADGKMRSTKRTKQRKPKPPETEPPELESTMPSEVEDNEVQADSESATVGVPVDSLEPFDLESNADSSDAHVEESQKAVASFELPDSSDPLLVTKFDTWLEHLPYDDKGRIEVFKPLFCRLLGAFGQNNCRLQFIEWIEGHLKSYKR